MADSERQGARASGVFVRGVWVVVIAAVALVGLTAALVTMTGSPQLCSSCHEMDPAVASWQTSSHAEVSCFSCHGPVYEWYQLPQKLAFQAQVLARDVAAHRAESTASALPPSSLALSAVPDTNCLHCHDLVREVTLPPGLVMDHAKHVQRNNSCTSCHIDTAHPVPDAEKAVTLMARCFACHGRQAGAKAPGNCDLCHTKSFSMRPQSHSPSDAWLLTHGPTAEKDRRQCVICHDQVFCDNCHKLPMPHPANWAARNNPAHAPVALKNPQICQQCHGGGANLCTMCHHQGFDLSHGPWATNHAPTVQQRGAAVCMNCHYPLFCVTCHTTGKVLTPLNSSSDAGAPGGAGGSATGTAGGASTETSGP